MSAERLVEVTYEHEWVFCHNRGCGWQREYQGIGLAQARAERDLHERRCPHRFE